jgi:hypothetical protein
LAANGTHLPEYVQRVFEDYLKCCRQETRANYGINRSRYLIQRAGSALHLYLHFNMLLLDGV